MVDYIRKPAPKPAHIHGPIKGLYTFRCSCSHIMGVSMFDRPPMSVTGATWPHIHKASWATPRTSLCSFDDTTRPVIMAIKPEYRTEDAYLVDGVWWDRRGF